MGTYGGVKPWVAKAGDELGMKFGIASIGGVAARSGVSDHPSGHALDFMCTVSRGAPLAAYARANWQRLNITYVIHNRKIWSVERNAEGWRPYSGASPHTDHVHISFNRTGDGSGASVDTGGGMMNAAFGAVPGVSEVGQVLDWLTDPQMWLRVAMFVGGGIVVLIALISLVKSQTPRTAVKSVARTVRKTRK